MVDSVPLVATMYSVPKSPCSDYDEIMDSSKDKVRLCKPPGSLQIQLQASKSPVKFLFHPNGYAYTPFRERMRPTAAYVSNRPHKLQEPFSAALRPSFAC